METATTEVLVTLLKRLTLMAVPLALGLSVASAPAQAAPAPSARAAAQAALAAEVIDINLPSYVTNTVFNVSDIGIGVIGKKDGVYNVPGKYDYVLPVDMMSYSRFGWNTTGGWYNGPGYCSAQLRSDDHGVTWRSQDDLGPGVHLIGATTSYAVWAYPC
jgi:hypothetical protein